MKQQRPTTSKKKHQETRNRALAALSRMRREKLSLAEASWLEHIKPKTVIRNVGKAIRQDRPGGHYYATKGDRLRRDLQIQTALGQAPVTVVGSRAATEIAKYQNAVAFYLRK